MTDQNVTLRIRANADGSLQIINQTERAVNNLGGAAARASGQLVGMNGSARSMADSVAALGRVLPGVFAGLGAAQLAASIAGVNREFNSTRNALTLIEGSVQAVNARWAEFQGYKIAAVTGVNDIAQAYTRLDNLALKANESILTGYANIAASNPGKRIGDVIEAVADATTGEFERLKEFGIKASKEGDNVSFAFRGVTTSVKNSADEIQNYLSGIGNTSFAGAIENQLNSIDGSVAHFKNEMKTLADDVISTDMERAIAGAINSVADYVHAIDMIPAQLVTVGDTNASVADFMSASWITVRNNAVNAIDSIAQDFPIIGQAGSAVAAFIQNYYQSLWQVLKAGAAGAANLIIGAFNAVGNSMGAIAAGIVNNFGQAFAKVKAMAAGIASGVKAAMTGDFAFADLNTAFTKQSNFTNVAADVKGVLGKAFSTDYMGNLGKQIKSTAADLHMIRTMTDAHSASMASARKHSDALAGSTHALGGTHNGAGGHAGKHAAATKRLSDAQQEAKKIADEGVRLTDSLATAQEKAAAEFANAAKLYAENAINLDTLDRALVKYKSDLEKTMPLVKQLSQSQDFSAFANDLQEMGYGADQIKEMLSQYKEAKAAIDANPGLGAGKVTELVGEKIKAEKNYNDIVKSDAKSTANEVSKAWDRAIENIQDSLGNAIEGALNGKGMKSFTDFAGSIKDVLYKAVSQSLSAGIIDGFKKGDWSSVFSNLALAGISSLVSWFSKSASTSSPSTATSGYSKNAFGTGSMAIADTSARGLFDQSTIETVREFNNSLKAAESGLKLSYQALQNTQVLTSLWTKFTNTGIGNIISDFGSKLVSGVDKIITSATQYLTSSAASGGVSSVGAGAGANIGGSALTSIAGYGAAALAIVQLGFDLYDIATNDFTTTMQKVTAAFDSASIAALGVTAGVSAIIGSIPIAGWIAAAALNVGSAINSMIDNGVNLINMQKLFFGHLPALVNEFLGETAGRVWEGIGSGGISEIVRMIFGEPKPPGATMLFGNSNNQADTRYNATNQSDRGGYFNSNGNQSASVGIDTAFGWISMRYDDIANITIKNAEDAFLPLLQTTRAYDKALATSLGGIDAAFGQTGETMRQFNQLMPKQKESAQNLDGFDASRFISDRFSFIGEVLGKTNTLAGQTASVWIKAFTDKLLKPGAVNAEYNTTTVFNIEAFIASQLPNLTQLPLRLADLFVKSVKSVADGSTQAEFESQMNDFFAGWYSAQQGLKNAGIEIGATKIEDYLSGLVGIGFSVKDSGNTLAAYAKLFADYGNQATNEFNKAFDSLLDKARNSGYGKEQLSGYISTYTLFGSTAKDVGVSASAGALDNLASRFNDLATQSTQTANDVIDHAIADEKLTNISRSAAIEQLRLSGKLDEAAISAASFGKSLLDLQQTALAGIEFANRIATMFFTNLGSIGISFESLTGLGANLTATFGDVGKAASWLDGILKTVYSPKDYAIGSQNAAQASFNSAASGAGFGGLNIDDFRKNFAVGLREYFVLAGSANEQDKARAASLRTLMDAGANLITANKALDDALGKTGDQAASFADQLTALADKFKSVNDQFNAIGKSAQIVGIDKIGADWAAADKQVFEEFAKTDKSAAWIAIAEAQMGRNAIVAGEQLVRSFDTINAAFNDIGKTDLQKSADKIKADMLAANDAVIYAFTKTDQSSAWRALAEAQIARNNAVAVEAGRALFGSLFQEFSNIGKSDTEKSASEISSWYQDVLKSVGDIALTYGVTNQQALDGINKIRDARVKALTDELIAADKVRQKAIADKGYSISDKILELTNVGALENIQRARALSALNSANYDEQMAAVDTLFTLSMKGYDDQLTAINKIKDASKSILDYVNKFKLGNLSTLSPEAKLAEARAQYNTQLAAARAGDADALGKVADSFNAYAEAGNQYFASSKPYQDIINQGLGDLSSLAISSVDPAQSTALNTANTVNQLKTLQDYLGQISRQQTDTLHSDLGKIATQMGTPQITASAVNPVSAVSPVSSASGGSVNPLVSSTPVMNAEQEAYYQFDSFIRQGLANNNDAAAFRAAAQFAIDRGFSKDQIADYVDSKFGIPKDNALEFMRIQGFAGGGYYPGGLAMVGEQGPELVNFDRPGQVYTAPQTRNILNGGDSGELIAELKELNKKVALLEEVIRLQQAGIALNQAGFKGTIEQNKEQAQALDALQRKQRIQEAVNS
jgi:hypothetical protein